MMSRLSQLSPTTLSDLKNLVSSEQAMFPLRFNLLVTTDFLKKADHFVRC